MLYKLAQTKSGSAVSSLLISFCDGEKHPSHLTSLGAGARFHVEVMRPSFICLYNLPIDVLDLTK